METLQDTFLRTHLDDMAFGYCPSGNIGELRAFGEALLAVATEEQDKRVEVLVRALKRICLNIYGDTVPQVIAGEALFEYEANLP